MRIAIRLLVLASALFLLVAATARSDGPVGTDPPSNFPLGEMPAACDTDPFGSSCENAAVHYLDQARASLDQPAYELPSDFISLTQPQQALILTNLDRTLYGLPPITGLTAALDSDAAAGVRVDDDPSPSDPDFQYYTANWAGGYPNMPAAYEGWMYDDGPGSGNLDCTSNDTSGCWGHRHDVLWSFDGSDPLAMGAAVGQDSSDQPGQAMLLGEGDDSYAPAYDYTWSDAQADGAGTSPYTPGQPPVPVPVAVTATGPGTVADPSGASCASSTCTFDETQGEPVTLTATAQTGASFGGWSGACTGSGRCTITPTGSSTTVGASFTGAQATAPPVGGTSGSGGATPGSGASSSAPTTLGSPSVKALPRIGRLAVAENVVRVKVSAPGHLKLTCALSRKRQHGWSRARFRSCAATVTYRKVARGTYRFTVRAGSASTSRVFVVRRR